MTVVWNFPTRILFGIGSAAETGTEASALGRAQALIVTDKGVREAGLVEDVAKSLRRAKVAFEVYDEVSSNPLESEVMGGLEAYRHSGADMLVGMGGGAAIDVAKLVRLLSMHEPPLEQYDAEADGTPKIVHDLPPMIALPTTAGTGSEVGRSAVATLTKINRKMIVGSPRLLPDVAILDPELTRSLPPGPTAATGFDALTHCIEAYCAKGDHPMADAIALEGIALIGEGLEKAVTDGNDLAARGSMMKAAMMGAVAFQKGLGVCHSLAHPLSAEAGLHHGLANALCLPAVLDFNRTAVGDRIARVARILGVRGDDLETLAFECSGAVRALRKKVGLPSGLAEAEIDEASLSRLAQLAFEDGCHQLNPRACTADDMLALYKASL